MAAPADRRALDDALRSSQRLGFLGDRPIPDVVDHAMGFVAVLADVSGRVVDLGAGGGVPGLVVAFERPDLEVTLLDRRTTRTDHLERLVGRLGWRDRVTVVAADADTDEIDTFGGPFDAAVARGFGPPETTLRVGVRVVVPGGVVVVSEPPAGDRWRPEILDELGVVRDSGVDRVARFRRR